MARILIAGATAESRERLYRLLSSKGWSPFRCCASGSELRRAMNECEDGIVILAGAPSGVQAEELCWDYGERFRILLIARPEVLDACETADVFRLAVPTSGQAVLGAVEMLSQMISRQLPRRTGADRQLVDEAKRILMQRQSVTEAEAHRMMQQYAMDHGIRMTDYALRIIRSAGRT
ncbi:MAG: ANTAR domain-containing protein [Clostridia bacterium]|nr:ANTAR domain-containing protein [Clostridia bacterium]